MIGPPKTPKSRRKVVLPRFVVDELYAQLQAAGANTPDDLIFPAPEGGSIRRNSWTHRFWKPALERAGLESGLGTHSQVTLLIAQGEHPKVIADRLGHNSVRTVLDVYGNLCEVPTRPPRRD